MKTSNISQLISANEARRECNEARVLRSEIGVDACYDICHDFMESGGVRRNKTQMQAMRVCLTDIADQYEVMTVRQLFYRATVFGLIEKTDPGYDKVVEHAKILRHGGMIPYERFADATRWMRKPTTWDSKEQMLAHARDGFRMSLWRDAEVYPEIWCEKDALAGVIAPVTSEYDVPLMVSRGFSSITYLHSSAQEIRRRADRGVKTQIFLMYDFDSAGQLAGRKIAEELRFMSGSDVGIEMIAVTPEQIAGMDLQTRDPKQIDRKNKWQYDYCCELDAIEPVALADLVESAIESVADADLMHALRLEEQAAKDALSNWIDLAG